MKLGISVQNGKKNTITSVNQKKNNHLSELITLIIVNPAFDLEQAVGPFIRGKIRRVLHKTHLK